MHTQTALDFKLYLGVVARKDPFQKLSQLHSKKAMTPTPPKFSQYLVTKISIPTHPSGVIFE